MRALFLIPLVLGACVYGDKIDLDEKDRFSCGSDAWCNTDDLKQQINTADELACSQFVVELVVEGEACAKGNGPVVDNDVAKNFLGQDSGVATFERPDNEDSILFYCVDGRRVFPVCKKAGIVTCDGFDCPPNEKCAIVRYRDSRVTEVRCTPMPDPPNGCPGGPMEGCADGQACATFLQFIAEEEIGPSACIDAPL